MAEAAKRTATRDSIAAWVTSHVKPARSSTQNLQARLHVIISAVQQDKTSDDEGPPDLLQVHQAATRPAKLSSNCMHLLRCYGCSAPDMWQAIWGRKSYPQTTCDEP